jgi:hypothetical protein
MRMLVVVLALTLASDPIASAQTKQKPPAKTTAPARTAPKPPAPDPALSRVQADLTCPSELGAGVSSKRRFCDVLAGRDPARGILISIPPHRGTVTLSFELHNRHTYSEDLAKSNTAFRKYTATVGVLTMDNTLVDRAVIQSEFRTERDLFDRIAGGAGPGGVKAVAPTGTEYITLQLPEDVGAQVSVLGEKLTVLRPDGTDTFVSEGRPVATISNVMVEFRPAPPAKKAPPKKAPTKKTPVKKS